MDDTIDLQQHMRMLEDALCTLQNLSLLADKEESARLEVTCQRIVSHIGILRLALT